MAKGKILKLKKKHKGIYESSSKEWRIKLINPKSADGIGSNEWIIYIFKNDEKRRQWAFKTKNEALKIGAEMLIEAVNEDLEKRWF